MSAKAHFSALIDDLCVVYDKPSTTDLKRLYWDDLGHLPIDAIEQAMRAHRRDPERGRFFPRPADLLARCRDPRGIHPAADAAWAIALASLDESASVVMTEQIAQARAAAHPIWEAGDKIGARMAFRAAYEQRLALTQEPPRWQFSAGHDPVHRAEVAERALEQGLLRHEQVARYLPAPAASALTEQITGLLTGQGAADPTEADDQTRARIAELKRVIAAAADKAEQVRRARAACSEARHRRRLDHAIEDRAADLARALAARQAAHHSDLRDA